MSAVTPTKEPTMSRRHAEKDRSPDLLPSYLLPPTLCRVHFDSDLRTAGEHVGALRDELSDIGIFVASVSELPARLGAALVSAGQQQRTA